MTYSTTGPAQGYISVIQHNAGKRDIAHHTALQLAFEQGADILLLQEPYCPRNHSQGGFIGLTHPAFHLLLPQPTNDPSNIAIRPRALAYIRKNRLSVTPCYEACNDPDLQIIKVFGIEPFYIINIYNEKARERGGATTTTTTTGLTASYTVKRLQDLYSIAPLEFPAVLAGDFNLHHTWWNPQAQPSRVNKARELVGWLDSLQATLLNDPLVTLEGGTLLRGNLKQESIIDLTFYTPFRRYTLNNWRYLPYTGSDHEAIGFTIAPITPLTPTPSSPQITPYNLAKADWELFRARLIGAKEGAIEDIQWAIDFEDLDSLATILESLITRAASTTIPKLRVSERSKPWWNPDLKALRKALNTALRRYKKGRTRAQEDHWKQQRNAYFYAVRAAKASYWETFLQGATSRDAFTAYSYTKPQTLTLIPSIRYSNREGAEVIANTFKDKCSAFLTTLFPSPPTTNPSPNIPAAATVIRDSSSSRGIPQKLTSLTSKARGEDSNK